MYEQQSLGSLLYIALYGASAMLSLAACFYLLFRRSNAIAPDVESPVRLRRWTAAFFASMSLSHAWYLPVAFHTSHEDIMLSYAVGAILDFMTLIPLAIVVLLVMLQDRRRPLWPAFAVASPFVVGLAVCGISRNYAVLPIYYGCYLLLGIALFIYMVRATRQYGRWLHDNYADLEHKEVWQSLVVMAVILLMFGIYSFDIKGAAFKYATQLNNIILTYFLLWRVETLSDLSIAANDADEEPDASKTMEDNAQTSTVRSNIGPLLKQYCEEPQIYLQHDISVTQLAQLIGTNRLYLSKYFAMQGTTYNAYINGLRIQHFINRYHESVATGRSVIAKQLAHQSGFRSYSTFSAAFKQIMGTTATEWMRNAAG